MFVRLFRYAKGDPNVALENFTTEALRTAIEDDPIPMIQERLSDLATAGIMDTIAQSNPGEPKRNGRVTAVAATAADQPAES